MTEGLNVPPRMLPLSMMMYQLASLAAHSAAIAPSEPPWLPRIAMPIDAVVNAATALEAFLNEQMAYPIASNPQEWKGPLNAAERLTSVEDKWLLVSRLLFGRTFDSGREPFQSFRLLVKLRNELVHYKPAFQTGDNMPSFATGLESKFAFSRPAVPEAFAEMGVTRVLEDWQTIILNAACARWACLTARKMVLAWHDLSGSTEHAKAIADWQWSEAYLEGNKPAFPDSIESLVVAPGGKISPPRGDGGANEGAS